LYQDLQKYLDEAPDGVIYFSMGSNLRSSSMPESKRNAFLGAVSKVKQHVLWKWQNDTLPGQPSNVKLGKWLPQSDILGECCYTGKTVGISCLRDGTYWRQWLRSSLAFFEWPLLFGILVRTFQTNHLPSSKFSHAYKGEKVFLWNGAT